MFLKLRPLFACLAVFVGILAFIPSAEAATTTVCGIGCDFTNLNDAVNAPHVTPDAIVVQVGYTFNFPPENNIVSMPDDLTITCDPGVIIGDALQTHLTFFVGSRNAFIGCTLDNVSFDASGKTDVSWLNNTFSSGGQANIVLTGTDGFTISGNTGIQHIQIQNSDNGLISNNTLECYNGTNCLGVETAGGGPFNYADPADVPNDIVINSNKFTNNYALSGGDFIHFGAGINIDYTSNTLQSIQTVDNYLTMLTIENASVDLRGNFFLFPEKTPVANNATWAVNLRISQADIVVNVENNSFIRTVNTGTNDGITCLGIYDSGMSPGLKTIDLNFSNNLCYDANTTNPGNNNGLSLGYAVTSSLVNLTEEYNGFYRFEANNLVGDQNGPHNTASPTDIIRNPVFRTEDGTSLNDFEPAPMSWYLDINGNEDIGAIGGTRQSIYTIHQGCLVDYVACMSEFASVLSDVLKSGDTVTIGDGTYPAVSINGPLSNVQLNGIGSSTIFDGQGLGSAFSLTNVTNVTLTDLSFINASATYLYDYTITKPILTFGGNVYDDSTAFGAPPNSVFYITDAFCNVEVIQADGDPVSVDGVNNINAILLNAGADYITVFVPNNVADDISDIFAPSFCGGGLPATHFINNVFTANGDGTYTYNPAALSLQGVSLAMGMTAPAITLNATNDMAAGLRLQDVTTSTFTDLTFTNNDNALAFLGNSAGNLVETAIFNPGAIVDIVSDSSGTNDLLDTTFNRTSSDITGTGNVRVRYRSIVTVSDSLLAPIAGIAVNFISANGLTNVSSTTDILGQSVMTDSVAYVMTSSSLALTNGGYNPFTITAFGNGTVQTTTTQAILDNVSIFNIVMAVPSIITPSVGGGGGGLPSVNGNGTYSFFTTTQSTGMVADSRTHQLIKLKDDGNAKTQEDSTVYYIGADGMRHAFPNPGVYGSWYCDFSQVKIVTASELASYRLGRNVTYRPGLRLVKFPTNPKVYVVQASHMLRALKDEAAAVSLFGANWAKQVSDIPDTFYNDYSFGEDVTATTDKAFLDLSPSYPSAEMSITGYQDITVPASTMKCATTVSSPTTSNTTTGAWPFTNIPKTYSFTSDLSSTSAPSADIRYLQEFLASKGATIYTDGRVTGTYGTLTTQAVKNYQKSKGISQTGTVGPATRAAINQELNALR